VAQSYAGWPAARTGGPVKGEEAPFDPDPPEKVRGMLDAIRHLEEAVTGAGWLEGVVLRYGRFYGPGTTLSAAIGKRQFPVVGDGGGIWSFIHVNDAAAATAVAVERGERGIYNVVDDDPAPARDWMPELARALGAKPPRRVPRWLGRLAAGAVKLEKRYSPRRRAASTLRAGGLHRSRLGQDMSHHILRPPLGQDK
jgi:2-alkyl-3-oxoalkanoate reductase